MALILNIDTAIDTASVCIAKDGKVLSIAKNEILKDHAAWLHNSIKEVFEKNNMALSSADAIAVSSGPGSYTGLRIGMATAKGICYALNKPLICLNTLVVMAFAKISQATDAELSTKDLLFCPMIDARRKEVYTAVYTTDLQIVKEPAAMELNENSFDEELKNNSICFFGNGSDKFKAIKKNKHAFFSDIKMDAGSMVSLAEEKFTKNDFADLAYAEPLYLKEFYSPQR